MIRCRPTTILVTAQVGALLALLWASGAANAAILPHADTSISTTGRVSVAGKTIRYTATAGQYPLYDNDTGDLMATMFFVAYVADRAPGASPRPLTFLWNGGPGSNSAQSHVVGFGPKRLKTPDRYPEWAVGLKTPIVDNPQTWLATSDLVFVDPPGTGYSRATSDRYRDALYTTRGDAEAVAELIRIYLSRNHRWDSPLFIAGESYGTVRAMWVANALEYRRTHLDGVILISGYFNLGQHVPKPLSTALGLDHLAATGYYFRLLAPEVQALPQDEAVRQAVEWARRVYAPALAHPEALSAAQREAVIQGLNRYTGIDPRYVNWQTLAIEDFTDNLLREKGLELGRYDSRMTAKSRGEGAPWSPMTDPSLMPMLDLMQGTSVVFNDYMRNTLKFDSDLLYRGPFGGAFHPQPLKFDANGFASDWMAARFAMDGYQVSNYSGTKEPPLRLAMELDPKLRVENMTGLYDGSCAAKDAQVAATDPQFRGRVFDRCYAGGHMWYSDKSARIEAQGDFARFVHNAISTQDATATTPQINQEHRLGRRRSSARRRRGSIFGSASASTCRSVPSCLRAKSTCSTGSSDLGATFRGMARKASAGSIRVTGLISAGRCSANASSEATGAVIRSRLTPSCAFPTDRSPVAAGSGTGVARPGWRWTAPAAPPESPS